MSDILILNGTLIVPSGNGLDEVSPGYVAIQNQHIVDVGPGTPPEELRRRAARVIDARHMAVLPGLVNGHTHLSQTFLRGLADDRPLLRWLKEIIWPAQAAMTPDDLHLAALLGLVENLRCGVTAVVQHHKLPARPYVDAVARAAERAGVRLLLARGWVDLGGGAEQPDAILDDMTWLHETWHGAAHGRIRAGFGPMAAWRCSDATMQRTLALAREWGVPTHIHVAEARDEIDLMLARCGRRHIEWLAGIGCLGADIQLVHAVHVTEAEMDLIAQAGASVVYCPTSNMYLASGAAPVRSMLDRGISVALGTDGSGSNNSQDLLECAKIGALLAKHATGNAQALLPGEMLGMMTRAGARLFVPANGLPAGGGRLEKGAVADIVVVDLNTPRCQPVHSVVSALVYNAAGPDVHTVIVDGEILVDAGRVTMLDEAALLEECRSAAQALLKRAGIHSA